MDRSTNSPLSKRAEKFFCVDHADLALTAIAQTDRVADIGLGDMFQKGQDEFGVVFG